MHNNIANISYENDSIVNFIQSSLFQVLHNERIPSWQLTDMDGNKLPMTPFISEVAFQLANKATHYACIYLNDDYNISLEKATSYEELLNIYDEDDAIEDIRTTFLYQENNIDYQLDFILDC